MKSFPLYDAKSIMHHPARQQRATYLRARKGLWLLLGVVQGPWLLLIMVSLMLFSACTVIREVGREYLSFSVLAINLQGIHNEPYGDDRVSWQDRYGRIANWMATTQKIPGLIALQQVDGRSGDVKDYETLFTLITKIREQTNVSYRIAYLIVRPIPQGLRPTLWQGIALLYNPNRLTNKTLIGNRIPSNFDDESVLGVHPRKSLPCQSPPDTFTELCGLIDGDGLAWISSYRNNVNRWIWGPAFARFELKSSPGSYIHIYNVHVQWEDRPPFEYLPQVQSLLNEMERIFGKDRLYPPIVLGDFNIGHDDMKDKETTEGVFKDFEIAGYATRDVMGVLVGEQSAFPSKQTAYFEHLIAPEDVVDPATRGTSTCGRVGVLWSDHCAVFVQFSPVSGP
jgi:hypothetical protein